MVYNFGIAVAGTVPVSSTKSDRSNEYEGSKHRVISTDAHYNETYYEGYYPQFFDERDSGIAYFMFWDMFGYDYPGVEKFVDA